MVVFTLLGMADESEYDMQKLLDDRTQIRARFAEWRKDPAFTPKSFLLGAKERLRKGELGTLEMDALSKVGKKSAEAILSEAATKVEKLKERGM